MRKNNNILKFSLLHMLSITLVACQNSEQKRIETRVEIQSFTKKVNEAIYAKDLDFIINNWSSATPKPRRSDLEHLFRQLDPNLSSSSSRYKSGFSQEKGKTVRVTNLYETPAPSGLATVTISASHIGKEKCCFIDNMKFDYKYKYSDYSGRADLKESNKSTISRRQFHIELKSAIFAKNTEFILNHWSQNANPVHEDSLIFMLNSISNEFSAADLISKDKPPEIFANRIVRHTQFSANGKEGDIYINLATSASSETTCCFIESLGIVSTQNPN